MHESQQCRSNLDTRLAERYGDSNSMPESQQCRSNLDQNWPERHEDSIRRYARITAVSVKSGSRLAGKYWHTTSRYSRITTPSSQILDQDWLRGMGIRRYARITAVSVKSGSKLAGEVLAYY